jgi:hypothetical protein
MRKVGRFRVSGLLLKTDLERVSEAFSMLKIVPLRAEHLFYGDYIEYLAYSPFFKHTKEGEEAPYYNFEMTTDENGLLKEAIFTQ